MASTQTFRFRSSQCQCFILGVVWLGLRCNSTRSFCTYPGYVLEERALMAKEGGRTESGKEGGGADAAAKCDVLRKWEVLGEKRATLFSADINEFSTYFLSFSFHRFFLLFLLFSFFGGGKIFTQSRRI